MCDPSRSSDACNSTAGFIRETGIEIQQRSMIFAPVLRMYFNLDAVCRNIPDNQGHCMFAG